jgi:integrase
MAAVPCRVGELIPARREQYSPFTGTIYIPDSKTGKPLNKPVLREMQEYFRNIPVESPWLFYK